VYSCAEAVLLAKSIKFVAGGNEKFDSPAQKADLTCVLSFFTETLLYPPD
jgi:hypothetical protein